jgi:hypothetical protein
MIGAISITGEGPWHPLKRGTGRNPDFTIASPAETDSTPGRSTINAQVLSCSKGHRQQNVSTSSDASIGKMKRVGLAQSDHMFVDGAHFS